MEIVDAESIVLDIKRIKRIKRIWHGLTGTVTALSFCAANSYGQDLSSPNFSLSGFGTLGAVHSNATNADFTGSFFQPDGAGYSHSLAWGVDSKIGVQIDARFSADLSAVVQMVSQHRYDGLYLPQVEWANLKYQFTPDFSIRAGKTVTAPFMQSETRLVGFTYPWIRPPQELYGINPFTNLTGIGISYRKQFGDVKSTINAAYGRRTAQLPGGGEATGGKYFEASDSIELGSSIFRIGYTHFQVSLNNPPIAQLFDGFTQFSNAASSFGFSSTGLQALALREQYQFVDIPYSIVSVGMNYDPGDWLLMFEWAKEKSPTTVSNTTAWYITGGYQFSNFTPYVTLAKLQPERRIESGISTAGLPPPLAAGATGLNTGLTAIINSFAFAQKSASVGLRWDFGKNTDLKFQYDHVITGSFSAGRLGNIQPNFQPGSAVNVFSLAVNFVF